MVNFTQRMYLENYHPDEKTTVVDLTQHALTIINGPHDEVETALRKGKKVVAVPGKHYAAGPIIDRLAEFEALGMEPEDIFSMYKAFQEFRKKYGTEKVDVEVDFIRGSVNRVGGITYDYVRETREYKCPGCKNDLAERHKTTKLFPDRTVVTDGCYGPVDYPNRYHCHKCGQALDWTDVDKETWV